MIVFYGGSSSGKSKAAEDKSVEIANSTGRSLIYLATMENSSSAAKERIRRHKIQREGKGFNTIEEMYNPASCMNILENKVILLECVSNLVANVFYDYSKGNVVAEYELELIAKQIFLSIIELEANSNTLIVVTNNVFSFGKHNDDWCDEYMKLLGKVNCMLANEAEDFYEVQAALLQKLK